MLGGGAYFEERNTSAGVPYDAQQAPTHVPVRQFRASPSHCFAPRAEQLPDIGDMFGPSKKEKDKTEEDEKKAEEPLPTIPKVWPRPALRRRKSARGGWPAR